MFLKAPLYCDRCFTQMATLRLLDQSKRNEHHEYWCDDCMLYREWLTTTQVADALNFFETTGAYDRDFHRHDDSELITNLPAYEALTPRTK